MKNILFILSSAALVFAACQKEENVANNGEGMFLTATVEQQVEGSDTKSSLSGTTVSWTKDDLIKVFDASGKYDQLKAQDSGTSVSFKETGTKESGFSESGNHYAIYPYSDGATCTGGTITFTLPATQTYAAGSFGQGANVAVASFSGSSPATFKNVCGVFKLSLCGNFKVSKIVLKTKGTEKLCGTFTVNAADVEGGTTYSSGAVDSLTLNCVTTGYTDGVQLDPTDSTTFYFVVPVGAFASGFVADVYENGQETATYKYTELSTTTANSIVRSRVKAMPENTILPPAYQKVEYLQSSCQQYINTNYLLCSNYSMGIKLDFESIEDNQLHNLFGSDDQHGFNVFFQGTNAVGLFLNGTYVLQSCAIQNNTRYTLEINIPGPNLAGTLSLNDQKYSTDARGYTQGSYPLCLYTQYYSGYYSRMSAVRICNSCSIFDNNVLVRCFIPAICKKGATYTDGNKTTDSSVTVKVDGGKPGMYDLVSGNFFVNQGTGDDFTTGSVVTH